MIKDIIFNGCSDNQDFKKIMINQEERKRKNNYIHQTNLIKGHSTKEEQNPNYENRKMLINKNKSHSPNNFANYHLPTKGKNIINFKPTKEIASKSQLELKKLTKNEESSGKLIPLKEPQAISINVNIQNMLQSYKRSPNKRQKEGQRKMNKYSSTVNIQKNKQQIQKSAIGSNKKSQQNWECKEILSFKKQKKDQILEMKPVSSKNKSFFSSKKPTHKTNEQMIKIFQSEIEEINSIFHVKSLIELQRKQQSYKIKSNYIEKNQKYFSWKMRAMLIDWIMQICFVFSVHKQTFFKTVYLIDAYLSNERNLSKSQFQLVGTASLVIASKLQEYEARPLQQFSNACNRLYPTSKISKMEQKICKTLKFKLNPPTIYEWTSFVMVQWDHYVDTNEYAKYGFENKKIHFKRMQSYKNYLEMVQLIDSTILDVETFHYRPKHIVCSFMYLLLGIWLGYFTKQKIVYDFARTSQYLLSQNNLNEIFYYFLQSTFGFPLNDLLPTIQYCATFFNLPLNAGIQEHEQENKEVLTFQEYASLQRFNSYTLDAVYERRKRNCL